MSKMGLFINYDICFGCHACEMACSQEKKLPAGEFGIKIAQYGPHKNINGDWEYTYLPIPTKLCDRAPSAPRSASFPAACTTARQHAWNTATWRSSPSALSSSRAPSCSRLTN